MQRYWHILATGLIAALTVTTPQIQAYVATHAKVSIVFLTVWTLIGGFLKSPLTQDAPSPNPNMGAMKIFLFMLLFFYASGTARSQTKPADILESSWNVAIYGGYSNVSGAVTNNGFFSSQAIRVATHWNIRADEFILNAPAVTIMLAGPEYRLSINHLFPNLSGNYAIINQMEVFANAKLGDARFSDPKNGTQSKFAYGAGAGFDIVVSPTVTVRPLDVSYIRENLPGASFQGFVGNHLQFEAGLGLRF